jgi:hypothetical protein
VFTFIVTLIALLAGMWGLLAVTDWIDLRITQEPDEDSVAADSRH